MAVKLSVGLQKKIGQPDYGSLGASCCVEFEIDRSPIEDDLDGFHQKVRGAFVACRQAASDFGGLSKTKGPSAKVFPLSVVRRRGRDGLGQGCLFKKRPFF